MFAKLGKAALAATAAAGMIALGAPTANAAVAEDSDPLVDVGDVSLLNDIALLNGTTLLNGTPLLDNLLSDDNVGAEIGDLVPLSLLGGSQNNAGNTDSDAGDN